MVRGSLTLVASWQEWSLASPVASVLRHVALFHAKRRDFVLWACHNCCAQSGATLCLAQESGVPFKAVSDGKPLNSAQRKNLKDAEGRLLEAHLTHWDPWGLARAQVEEQVLKFAREGGSLLVVDAPEMLGKEELRQDQLEWLRGLATRTGMAVLAGLEVRAKETGRKYECFWNLPRLRLHEIPEEHRKWADSVLAVYPDAHKGPAPERAGLHLAALKHPAGTRDYVHFDYDRASGKLLAHAPEKGAQ